MQLVEQERRVLGDVGDRARAERDHRHARSQFAEHLLDRVIVSVGLAILAGLKDDRSDLPAGVGEQSMHQRLEVLAVATLGVASCTRTSGPGARGSWLRIVGSVRIASGPISTRFSSKWER